MAKLRRNISGAGAHGCLFSGEFCRGAGERNHVFMDQAKCQRLNWVTTQRMMRVGVGLIQFRLQMPNSTDEI